MATNNTEIANLALLAAGATKLLTSLENDKSPEAGALRLLLPQYRDELLESYRWKFATSRVVLAALQGVTRTDWIYVYAAPSDLLTPRRVVPPGVRNPGPEDEIPFDLEAGDAASDGEPDGQVILCDQPSAEFIYTGRCTKPIRFSALFTSALVWRLALHAALYLTKKDSFAKVAQAEFEAALEKAKVHSANQGKAAPPPAPDFLEGYEGVPQRFRTALD